MKQHGRAARTVARTALCAWILLCGCATRHEISFDAQNPAMRVSRQGILFGETFVRPQEAVGILRDYDIPRSRTIHIRLDKDVRDLGPARALMGHLSKAGYKNSVLVTERHSESVNLGKPKKKPVPQATKQPRKVRYKRKDE